MTLADLEKLDFITFEYGYRYKISPRKAGNTMILNTVLELLKAENYTLYQLFQGGYIFAEKQH